MPDRGLALRAFRADADLVLGVGTRFMTTFGRQIDVGRAALVLLNLAPVPKRAAAPQRPVQLV